MRGTLACLVGSASAFTLQPTAFSRPARATVAAPLPAVARSAQSALVMQGGNPFSRLFGSGSDKKEGEDKEGEEKMTIEKIASFGIAGVLSIAVVKNQLRSNPSAHVSLAC